MTLQCGIIGVTNTGKTTLFNCISNTKAETTRFAFSTDKSNIGRIVVPDNRLYELEKLYTTEKVVPTTVEILDIPGLTKGSSRGEGVGNKFLGDIRNTDALIHVLRCFDDPNLPHIDGSVDPVRDKETIELELQIKDLESIEKKIQKLGKIAKAGDKNAGKGIEVLNVYKEHIEGLGSARTVPVNEKDKEIVDDLFLLTSKSVLYVCNVDEASAVKGNMYVDEFKKAVEDEKAEVIVIAAGLEAEIAELDDPEDRMEFLADIGLSEPGVNKFIRSAYKLLNLQTFFTMNSREIRAWTFKKGTNAPQSAGIVHSDMERGFIRAEVMKYEDFVSLGSEQACREAGKQNIEGKNYVVQDGDILYIRFNV
ncbi:MAG: redox-regulated ATPase YchF [Bacteroidales bacterium]|nr:redox-regulated ATPase YchF [Bacteroidales bacterium]